MKRYTSIQSARWKCDSVRAWDAAAHFEFNSRQAQIRLSKWNNSCRPRYGSSSGVKIVADMYVLRSRVPFETKGDPKMQKRKSSHWLNMNSLLVRNAHVISVSPARRGSAVLAGRRLRLSRFEIVRDAPRASELSASRAGVCCSRQAPQSRC